MNLTFGALVLLITYAENNDAVIKYLVASSYSNSKQ